MKYEFENSDFYKANIKIIKEEETKKEWDVLIAEEIARYLMI